MTLRFPTITLLCLVSFSCDKAKPGTTPDPALQKLVDQTAEGVVFRKDLPFPGHLEVKTTRRQEMSGRSSEVSAIETHAIAMKGTSTDIMKYERAGGQVRCSRLESTFAEPVVEKSWKSWRPWNSEKKPAAKVLAPPSKPVVFKKSGATWKSDDSEGFRAAALSQQLSPVFDQLLVENALATRSLWFGKRRFKIGDQLAVSGKSLPMLVTGNAKGSLTLTLKSFEAVNGHPCGVFAVTGDYSRKQLPDFDGNLTDEDVAIRSGKLWLSLIYPLILREETDTIQTRKSGGQGDLATRYQGSVKVSVTREWKKTGP